MKPSIILTGASGFIGRNLLRFLGERYRIFAVARRSPFDAGIVLKPHIRWIPLDIGEEAEVKRVMTDIRDQGGADYLLHLAAYYDYSDLPNVEYERTNVAGTRNLLKHADLISLRRFVFVSSLTVSRFPDAGNHLDETSAPDAEFHYARSKREGEKLVKEYARRFPCSVVRLAAIFSDWCEYAPLYNLLSTWLSSGWRSRFLPGAGKSALPYLHVQEVCRLLLKIMEQSDELPGFGIYVAGRDGCTSQNDLYSIAGRYFFGEARAPIHMPKPLVTAFILFKYLQGRLSGHVPFEQPWMTNYIDLAMPVDSSSTREALSWTPSPRLDITRRLLFLIENMKNNPALWKRTNDEAAHLTSPLRRNFKIYQAVLALEERNLEKLFRKVVSAKKPDGTPFVPAGLHEELRIRLELLFRGLDITIRIRDRSHILDFARDLTESLLREGVDSRPFITKIFTDMADLTQDSLLRIPELQGMEQRIHDLIFMTFQLVNDEVEEVLDVHGVKTNGVSP